MDENHRPRTTSGSLTIVSTRTFHPSRKRGNPDAGLGDAALREKASGLPETAPSLLVLGTRIT